MMLRVYLRGKSFVHFNNEICGQLFSFWDVRDELAKRLAQILH